MNSYGRPQFLRWRNGSGYRMSDLPSCVDERRYRNRDVATGHGSNQVSESGERRSLPAPENLPELLRIRGTEPPPASKMSEAA
jgi:hypothetical protein